MQPLTRLLVVCAWLIGPVVVGAGCGDLSQEDLVFRAGVPTKEAVAVVPPGTEAEVDDALSTSTQGLRATRTQAVEERCDGDLLCETRNLARGFNGFTFFLLDIVDTISALPPSERSPGRRVWGPHFDGDQGATFRFEMNRSDDGATFSFCLHAARGFVGRAPEVTCDTESDEASGLQRVLTGAFQPSAIAGDGARLGKGTMSLAAERLNALNGEARFARVVDFAFDHTDGESNIHIDMLGTSIDNVEAITDNVVVVSEDVRDMVARIHNGEGSIGRLLQDEEIFDDVREFVRELKRRPWRIIWKE
jgi:hypothetical protein